MAMEGYSASMPSFGGSFSGGQGGGLSSSTFSNAGGAVQDLFSAKALKTKAKGSRAEAEQYDIAAAGALRNAEFVKTSTEIKTFQASRSINKTIGGQAADVAASGFAATGSALDLLRDSASEGALYKAVLGQQGLIEEAGYKDQAKSYQLMASAARMAADAEDEAASGAKWGGALKGAAAGASAGAAFGPWGAVIGGVAGGAAGYLGSE
jgi:hypothetical protein